MASPLDQVVKGAPTPDARASTPEPLSSLRSSQAHQPDSSPQRPSTPDPLAHLPSSPPQIYLNLLILETSLRAQYLALRERRHGRGVGGSVYWVVEMGEKVALLGGVVTALLVWGTGQWERGIRWPRRWLAVSNRGLRVMNTKIIIIRGPFWQELLSYSPADKRAGGSRQHYQQYYNGTDNGSSLVEEDLSPGGDYIRLLLLPKSFSPEFRENWDDYRTDFWEKENERRAQLRLKLREREQHLARTEGGWLGRLGLGWRASQRRRLVAGTLHRSIEPEFKHRLGHGHRPSISKLNQEQRGSSRRNTRSESHSRTSSRSTTPVDTSFEDRPSSRSSTSSRPRRGSTASGQDASPQQRKRKGSTLRRGLSPLTQAQIREGVRTPSFSSDDSVLPMGMVEKDKEEAIPNSVPENTAP
ncbi:hypothetical protein N7519_000720 [Penicillium mononematosum]|uniref:uncharacterized protein n=1 Tax=Penicillium mononematosum TaxID=268346 RepID=UPI0025486AE0|nr:uncharacterized protein N7519_000720 [Penicillium mononematosum]KAJ6190699.1 hypothetical protein N7519_000720 [Penicillium mononematosum]